VLLDADQVIVHLFAEEARSFYALEHLWADAPRLSAEELATERPSGQREAAS
jgi:ribosomal silencing factor RsfS